MRVTLARAHFHLHHPFTRVRYMFLRDLRVFVQLDDFVRRRRRDQQHVVLLVLFHEHRRATQQNQRDAG